MKYRRDRTLEAALDLQRAPRLSRGRALGFAALAVGVLVLYAIWAYRQGHVGKAAPKKPASMPPASAPSGH